MSVATDQTTSSVIEKLRPGAGQPGEIVDVNGTGNVDAAKKVGVAIAKIAKDQLEVPWENILDLEKGYFPSGWLIREALMKDTSFDEAVDRLSMVIQVQTARPRDADPGRELKPQTSVANSSFAIDVALLAPARDQQGESELEER